MKRFLFPSIFFFTFLLFLFVPFVNADTPVYYVDDTQFNYITNAGFLPAKQFCDDNINQSTYKYTCYVYFLTNDNTIYAILSTVNSIPYFNNDTSNSRFITPSYSFTPVPSGNYRRYIYKWNGTEMELYNTNNSLSSTTYNISYNSSNYLEYKNLLYYVYDTSGCSIGSQCSNFTPRSNVTFDISYGSQIYHVLPNGQTKFPTLYDLYLTLPTDDTPLLSSFFNISIEKIQLISEYFSSNYLYLSLFCIFIFIFIIFVLKRRLF